MSKQVFLVNQALKEADDWLDSNIKAAESLAANLKRRKADINDMMLGKIAVGFAKPKDILAFSATDISNFNMNMRLYRIVDIGINLDRAYNASIKSKS